MVNMYLCAGKFNNRIITILTVGIHFIPGVLWTGGFTAWMRYLTQRQIDPSTWTDCKVTLAFFYFFAHYSSCLLIAMAVEKCVALYFPLHTKSICTVRTAKKISAAAALILFAFNAQLFFIRGTETDSNVRKTCIWVRIPQGYELIYLQIDAILYSFIPLSVMFTANCLIILKFMMAKWKNRRGGTESVNQALSKSAVKGTVMLFTVSFAFVILTGSVAMAKTIVGDKTPVLVYGITILLQYLNHSINGVLYCISGSRFRKELRDLFNCFKTKRTLISNTIDTSTSMSVPEPHPDNNRA